MKQGLIHIYCGDGKGKTSAATGLAVRAAGCGMKVLFARFLKNDRSGEVPVLEQVRCRYYTRLIKVGRLHKEPATGSSNGITSSLFFLYIRLVIKLFILL